MGATWADRHPPDWRDDRDEATEGEVIPRAALPKPAPRLPAPERSAQSPETCALFFEPNDWIRGGDPEQVETARVTAGGAPKEPPE